MAHAHTLIETDGIEPIENVFNATRIERADALTLIANADALTERGTFILDQKGIIEVLMIENATGEVYLVRETYLADYECSPADALAALNDDDADVIAHRFDTLGEAMGYASCVLQNVMTLMSA